MSEAKFTVIPAIDLKDGKCVRLRQGRPDDVTVYSDDPVQMALQWENLGARRLHVVDLDGAFKGSGVHNELVSRICKQVDIPVELGGGLRTEEDVERALGLGIETAIVGTRAATEPETVRSMANRFGSSLGVGIDARNGQVMIKGWAEASGAAAVDIARQMDSYGVGTLIYTDISRDGMLTGINLPGVDAICRAVGCRVIASGGVSKQVDVDDLKALQLPNLIGVIVGKALYEGKLSLEECCNADGR
jgi:phosphoribosylformimino-5-aminoimidazole carboxamide ribotide isomerase